MTEKLLNKPPFRFIFDIIQETTKVNYKEYINIIQKIWDIIFIKKLKSEIKLSMKFNIKL